MNKNTTARRRMKEHWPAGSEDRKDGSQSPGSPGPSSQGTWADHLFPSIRLLSQQDGCNNSK